MSLPPFLQPYHPPDLPIARYRNAIFSHKYPFGSSHALWWPPKLSLPTTVILFLPGNPGLLNFYIPFLESLYARDTTSSLAIFACSHIGHTPGIDAESALPTSRHGLSAQIEGSIEAFDAIQSNFGAGAKVVVVGHSVGGWLSLQVLKARPSAVAGVFLLFPTISHIRETPNGRMLSWLLPVPMRNFVSWLSYLSQVLPLSVLALLFSSWPSSQVLVLRTLLYSPSSILAMLHMADDEMHTIRDLDVPLLTAHRDRLWIYFAKHDNWVGKQINDVIDSFKPELEKFRFIHGHESIPHAFCINHGEQVASQCHQWLNHLRSLEV